MHIIIVTDEIGIEVYKTWREVKKYTSWQKQDFTKYGTDYILNTTQDSFNVSKDIKLLENVAAQKMFTKNKMDFNDLLTLITLMAVVIGLAV